MLADRHPAVVGQLMLGLNHDEADVLFYEFWRPVGWNSQEECETGDLSPGNARAVARALRNLGDGDSIWDVTERGR